MDLPIEGQGREAVCPNQSRATLSFLQTNKNHATKNDDDQKLGRKDRAHEDIRIRLKRGQTPNKRAVLTNNGVCVYSVQHAPSEDFPRLKDL